MSAARKPVALVTGAADGIGWAIARRFAAAGCRVALADLAEERVRERAWELGREHLALAADVAEEAAVVRMVGGTLEHFGRLDMLVNNAGIGDPQRPTLEQDAATFDRILAVHLRGTFTASREAARAMAESGGGAILNLASIAG